MKKTNMLLAIFLITFFAVENTIAQTNIDGFGLRVNPDGAGLTGKFFLNPHLALEGQVNGSGGFYHAPHNGVDYGPSFALVGLAEYNIIFPNPQWRVFIGAGLHLGTWDRFDHRLDNTEEVAQGVFGVDGILGIEYLFRSMPLGLSLDAKPAYNITVEQAFFPNNLFGLSARYYFGHKVKLRYVETKDAVEETPN